LLFAGWVCARKDAVRQSVDQLLGAPPRVTDTEANEARLNGPTLDHSTYDTLLRRHVDTLTRLYDGNRHDFIKQSPVVFDFAGQCAPSLREALATGDRPAIGRPEYGEYGGRLNWRENRIFE
jgi:hypothetical protein